jgi:hypothetical protein
LQYLLPQKEIPAMPKSISDQVDTTGYEYNEHNNQLGDWCPWSGVPANEDDDACPAGCPASNVGESEDD